MFVYDPFSKKITFNKIDVIKVIEDEEQLKINDVTTTITKTFVSSFPYLKDRLLIVLPDLTRPDISLPSPPSLGTEKSDIK